MFATVIIRRGLIYESTSLVSTYLDKSKGKRLLWQKGLPAIDSSHVDDAGAETSEVTACYALSDAGGAGTLSAAEFGRQSSFPDWDFESVWDLSNGVRPVLRCDPEDVRPKTYEGVDFVPARRDAETRFDAVDPAKGGSMDNFKASETYADGRFTDVSPDDWFAENVRAAVNYGLLLGRGDGVFGVGEKLKVSEAMAIACRLHNVYYGGSGVFDQTKDSVWYQVYADYAACCGFAPKGLDPEQPITRGQFTVIVSAALPDEALAPINDVTALPDVASDDPACAAILRLYNADILTGVDDKGTFLPDALITREQIAAVVTRAADPGLRKTVMF